MEENGNTNIVSELWLLRRMRAMPDVIALHRLPLETMVAMSDDVPLITL